MNIIRQLFAAPVFEDEDKTRAASLLNNILLSNLAIVVMAGVIVPLTSPAPAVGLTALGITILLVLGGLFLVRVGRVRLASVLFSSALWALATILIHVSGGMRSVVLITYALVIIQLGLLLGGHAAIAFTGLSILTGLGMLHVESRGLLPSPLLAVSSTAGWLALTANLIMAALMLYVATRSINEAMERAHRNERTLAESNRELEAEITERKRAEEVLQQHARNLELLNRTSQAFGSTLDLDQVLATVLEEVRQMLGVVASSVWLVDPETDELVCLQATGPKREIVCGWRLAPAEGLAGWVARHGESLILPDAQADERHFKDVDQQTGLDLRSILVVPLWVKQDVIGVLEVMDTEVGRFNPTHLTLLELLARSAAIAVENARLYEKAQQEIAERKRAEEAYRALVEHSLQGLAVLQGNSVVFANATAAEMLGYTIEELISLSPEELRAVVHPEDQAFVWGRYRDRLAGKTVPPRYEFRMMRKDGTVRWVEMSSSRIEYGEKPAIQAAIVDITERKRAEEQLQTSLQEKEVLLKEIHHRVKNNLQVISSLLSLQAGYVEDEQVVEMLQESRNRVRFMALVHEKLYRSQGLARVDFAEYIQSLTAHLFRSYRVRGRGITLKMEVSDVALGIDAAVPCGLIVNELMSNALKHAFPDSREGEIRIELCSDHDGQFTLMVSDNGVGFPQDLDFRNTESLGLQLVNTLVVQLEGTIELDRRGGTAFKITFTT